MRKLTDGNEPDVYDRIRDHILNGTQLKGTDAALAKAAQATYPIMVEEMTQKDSVAKILSLGLASNQAKAIKLIHDTEKIYGRVYEGDRTGRKAILLEVAWEALREAREKAQETGNFSPVQKLIDQIAKLGGYYETADNIRNVYQQLVLPTPTISADPAALNNKPTTIEIDGE